MRTHQAKPCTTDAHAPDARHRFRREPAMFVIGQRGIALAGLRQRLAGAAHTPATDVILAGLDQVTQFRITTGPRDPPRPDRLGHSFRMPARAPCELPRAHYVWRKIRRTSRTVTVHRDGSLDPEPRLLAHTQRSRCSNQRSSSDRVLLRVPRNSHHGRVLRALQRALWEVAPRCRREQPGVLAY